MLWDVFISHASEDKAAVARPLARQLEELGLRVWLDETQLKVGDSLRARIDEGLAQSRFGVVVLSPAFFGKKWPQRELAGLFARGDVILPVWHETSAKEVAAVSPMLADIVATSTSEGLQEVAQRILAAAAPYLRPADRRAPRPYSPHIGLPTEALQRALDAIESMAQPATWRHLEITASGYPETGWMGCDSATLIEVLHSFAAPLYAARALSYDARRNLALLDRRSRLKIGIATAALDAFLDEAALATTYPPIPYTPRVANWRAKRVQEPARYWWQGLSADRFDGLRALFLRPGGTVGSVEIVPASEFHDAYRSLFGAGCPDRAQQQALGLLGNGFYGFLPRTRPVLWRVLICHARLYHAALGNTDFEPDRDQLSSVARAFVPRDSSVFPFSHPSLDDHELYEPFDVSLSATTSYLNTFVVPRLSATLAATRES
jgi:hypothetical protein